MELSMAVRPESVYSGDRTREHSGPNPGARAGSK
jgi:hypothetical protein